MALNMDTDIPIIELADNTPSWDIQWNENTHANLVAAVHK